MLEPSTQPQRSLFVQRLEGAAWSPPVPVAPAVNNSTSELARQREGAPHRARSPTRAYRLDYATSTDGGVLWSSLVDRRALRPSTRDALEGATASDGRGAAVVDFAFDDKSVRVTRFSRRIGARRAPRASKPRARAGPQRLRRRQSSRSSSRPRAATAASRPRRSCVAPASAAPAGPAAASAPASARATSCACGTRGSPCGSPRAAARRARCAYESAAAARRADVRRPQRRQRPHARPGRADPGARGGAALRAARSRPARRRRVRDRLGHRRARRLARAPPLDGHRLRQADGPARRQAADHRRARLARRALPPRRVGRDGDHRARVRGHRSAHAGHRAGPGHLGERLGQAQDDRPRSRWCWR